MSKTSIKKLIALPEVVVEKIYTKTCKIISNRFSNSSSLALDRLSESLNSSELLLELTSLLPEYILS